MFQSGSHRENDLFHNTCLLKIDRIKFSSFQLIDDVLWWKIKWRTWCTGYRQLLLKTWTTWIASIVIYLNTNWETVGISEFQVRRKTFVPFFIEIVGLTITSLWEERSIFKSITSTPKTPHPHNVHLTLCVEKSIYESSLINPVKIEYFDLLQSITKN